MKRLSKMDARKLLERYRKTKKGKEMEMKIAIHQQIEKERSRILNSLLTTAAPQRATIKVVRRILLNAPYLYRGISYDVKAKSLGAGVYELTLINCDD